jgi:arylsulfatase A-like enzyme
VEPISENSSNKIKWIAFSGLVLASYFAFKLYSIITEQPPKPSNLLLITLDTLRPDHLSVYGYDRPTSPSLLELAKEGITFEKTFTVAASSGPSHATLVTGLYPAQHGLMSNGDEINAKANTLAQTLDRAGYNTAGFVGYHALNREAELDKGFKHFEFNPIPSHDHDKKEIEDDLTGFVAVVDWLNSWIDNPKKSSFFIWLHVQNIHGSYDPPPPYKTMFGKISEPQHLDGFEGTFDPRCFNDLAQAWRNGIMPDSFKDEAIALYDGEIRLVDDQLGQLFKMLKSFQIYDDTVIVIVSDHGEVLFELYGNGFYKQGPGHGARYVDASIHVPLIFKPAKHSRFDAGRRVNKLVSTIDLYPTVLELLRIPVPLGLPGESLTPQMRDPNYSQTQGKIFFHEKPWGVEYTGIRTDKWKYVEKVKDGVKSTLLIDLMNDPKETSSANSASKTEVREFQALLGEWKNNMKVINERKQVAKEMTKEMREALRDGGYLSE